MQRGMLRKLPEDGKRTLLNPERASTSPPSNLRLSLGYPHRRSQMVSNRGLACTGYFSTDLVPSRPLRFRNPVATPSCDTGRCGRCRNSKRNRSWSETSTTWWIGSVYSLPSPLPTSYREWETRCPDKSLVIVIGIGTTWVIRPRSHLLQKCRGPRLQGSILACLSGGQGLSCTRIGFQVSALGSSGTTRAS